MVEQLSFRHEFFSKDAQSHDVSEVKISRGCLVHSNLPWIRVAADGSAVDAKLNCFQVDWFESLTEYWNHPYWGIGGLYSPRWLFYRIYIPHPQLNWPDFISLLVGGKP